MRGVIAVIPAKKTFCKNQEKLTKNRDFYLKSVKKINNFRVRGVIVPPLPRFFRVRGVIAVIPAKMTFCRIDYFRYPKNFLRQKTKTVFFRKFSKIAVVRSHPFAVAFRVVPKIFFIFLKQILSIKRALGMILMSLKKVNIHAQ